MRQLFRLAALAIALAPVAAVAQPSRVIPEEPPPPPKPAKKNPWIAVGLSAAGLAAGVGMIEAGNALMYDHEDAADALWVGGGALLMIGPSAGHLYAGAWEHAVATTTIRIAGAGLVYYGMWQIERDEDLVETNEYGEELVVVGAALFAGATLFDLIDAPFEVRRSNRRALAIAPTVNHHGVGLAIAGTLW